jgi:CubicO group peptidase (beta-lactamase class C family)
MLRATLRSPLRRLVIRAALRSLVRRVALPTATAAIALAAPLKGQDVASPPNDAQLVARIHEYMNRLEGFGYTGGVLVVRDGRVVMTRSYGMANRADNVRADTNTVYNLGSITKQFTAAAILRLEEQGKLRTTDSIARFFPTAPVDKRAITLHQLLTHTAGFNADYSPGDYEETSRNEYMRRMLAAPLRSAPGTQHVYSNAGYSMLAAIVELITGRDYETALRELVLQPAGMRETGYKAPAWAGPRIAHGYQNGRDWGTIVDRIKPAAAPYWALRGNGGLHTTLGDMARWEAALNDTRVLSDSSRRKFMTGHVAEGPDGVSQYAYGWAVMKTTRGTRLVTHNGGNGIYVAELLRFVDDRVTLFVTSTVSEYTATQAVRTIARIAFGQPYELPPVRAAVAPTAVGAAVGTYLLPDGSRLVLRSQEGRLMADAVGQQAYALLITGDTASPVGAAAANARAQTIVTALVAGNVAPLHAALGPGAPDSAEVAAQEGQMMTGRLQRFGAYQSFDVLGTVPGPEGGIQTTVRLNYSGGGATNIYTWDRSAHIVDLGARPYQGTELVPSAPGEFRAFDGRGGVRLTFDAGTATAITPRGRITLRRQ